VAVTRRERMESWLGALAAAGLAPTHLAPVTLSVPLADRAWTLAFVDGESCCAAARARDWAVRPSGGHRPGCTRRSRSADRG